MLRVAGMDTKTDAPPIEGAGGTDLPAAIAAFVDAVNAHDVDAIVRAFADRALVNDELQEHWDAREIANWAQRDVVGQGLAIEVCRVVRNGDHTVVSARVDGNFDKRGLPDPLVLTFYFCEHQGKLVQLLILRNEPALTSSG